MESGPQGKKERMGYQELGVGRGESCSEGVCVLSVWDERKF
jgi:hypothetical protein